MRRILLLITLTISLFCRAQSGSGKALVIKVRAPKETCSIYTEQDFFWQEKNNIVRIKTRNGTGKIQVVLTGGKITAQDGENYTFFFTQKSQAAVTVYRFGPYGREVLLTKTYQVHGPVLWFCGIKTDSTSTVLRLNGAHLYAWSDYFKQALPVRSFDMIFSEDTVRFKDKKQERFRSDTCTLSKEMRNKVLNYQPRYNYIYFHNIVYEVPDGTKRLHDPIRFHAETDTTNKKTLSLTYAVYTMFKDK